VSRQHAMQAASAVERVSIWPVVANPNTSTTDRAGVAGE